MSLLSSLVPCEDLQADLSDFFTRTDNAQIIETFGWLQFLTDPINTDGLSQEVAPGEGKLRNINLIYKNRLPETEVSSNFNMVCSPTKEVGDTSTQYSIDPDADGNSIARVIPLATLREKCKNNSDWFMEVMMLMVNALDRANAQKMADQIPNITGAFVDQENVTNEVKEVQTIDASGNNTQNALEEIVYNSENNAYPGSTFVFGWGELKKYFTRVAAGCCIQTGVDLRDFASQNPMGFRGDYRIPGALGTDHFITVAPGAAQVLQYVEFEGSNTTSDESFEQTTIVSPSTGLKYDLLMTKSCVETGVSVSINLRNATKLVALPDDMFCADDRLSGVNFINEYQIVNP